MQECGLGLIPIRRGPDRLSFASPRLIRSGPVQPEILARVAKGLDLAPDAIINSDWVDNSSGWLAIMLRSRKPSWPSAPTTPPLQVSRSEPSPHSIPQKTEPPLDLKSAPSVPRVVVASHPITGSLNAGLGPWLIKTESRPQNTLSVRHSPRRNGLIHIQQDGSQIWIGGAIRTCGPGNSPLSPIPMAVALVPTGEESLTRLV